MDVGQMGATVAQHVSSFVSGLGLTQYEIGTTVGASPRSVARWALGEAAPQRVHEQRLLELAYVAEAVIEIVPADRARMWLLTPDRLVRHETPAARIHSGAYRDVLNLIDALAEGVVA